MLRPNALASIKPSLVTRRFSARVQTFSVLLLGMSQVCTRLVDWVALPAPARGERVSPVAPQAWPVRSAG